MVRSPLLLVEVNFWLVPPFAVETDALIEPLVLLALCV